MIFRGILVGIFRGDTKPCLRKYESLPGGDWAIYRGGAVFIEDAERVTVQNCTFDRVGGNGVFLSNHVTDSRNTVTLNHIHEVGITGKGQAAYFQALARIECNDGFGGGYHFADNLLFHFSRETGGHSAWNAWDREPFLTLVDGKPSVYPAWSTIERNFIISYKMWTNSPNSDWCLDWDDGASFYIARDNVCLYGNIKTHGSGAKYMYRNLLMYSDSGVPSEGGDHFFNNTCQLWKGPAGASVMQFPGCKKASPLETLPSLHGNEYYSTGQTVVPDFAASLMLAPDPTVGCLPPSPAPPPTPAEGPARRAIAQ
eukprot:gene3915-16687_t